MNTNRENVHSKNHTTEHRPTTECAIMTVQESFPILNYRIQITGECNFHWQQHKCDTDYLPTSNTSIHVELYMHYADVKKLQHYDIVHQQINTGMYVCFCMHFSQHASKSTSLVVY